MARKAFWGSQAKTFAKGEEVDTMAYIARADCGCITMAVVDKYEHANEIAQDVAQEIRDGRHIQRVKASYVRGAEWLCSVHKAQETRKEVMDRLQGRLV